MADVNKTVQVVVTAQVEQAGRALQGFAKNSKESIESISKSAVSAGKALTAFGAVAAAGMYAAVNSASEFETRMSDISTLISGDSTEAVNVFKNGIEEMVKTIPKSADELGASAYAIVSAGISDASDSLLVLEQSAKLAVAGLGTTEEATDLMTSAINAFGLEASDSEKIADTLFKTVKNGKTTVSQVAQAFGATAPVVAAAGVSLEDFSAATAALTTTGLPASQAQNSLRAAIVSLQKPTKEMQGLFENLGVKNMAELIDTTDNLGVAFGQLREATLGNDEVLAKAFGSVEALNAVIGLTDTTSEAYINTLKNMTEEGDAVQEAFQKQSETFKNQYQILKNQLSASMRTLGNAVMPILISGAKVLGDVISRLTEAFNNLSPTTQKIIAVVGVATTAFAAIAGPMLILIGTVLPALVTGVGAVGTALTFLAANPVVLAIAGITALIAAGVLLYQNWETVKAKTLEIWGSIPGPIQDAVRLIVGIVTFGGSEVLAAVIKNWEEVKAFLVGTLDFLKALITGFMETIIGIFTFDGERIKAAWSGVWDAAVSFVSMAAEAIKGIIAPFVDYVAAKIETLMSSLTALKQKATGVASSVTNALPGARSFDQFAQGLFNVGGARANGGPVSAGTPYLVGERGPEYFVPKSDGTILPNGQSPGGVKIDLNFGNVNISNGADQEAFFQMMESRLIRAMKLNSLGSI